MIVRRATVADAEAIGRIHVESWRTTYAGIVPAEFLAALSAERRAEQWRAGLANPESPTIVLVGELRPGEIAGFAACGPEREGLAAYPVSCTPSTCSRKRRVVVSGGRCSRPPRGIWPRPVLTPGCAGCWPTIPRATSMRPWAACPSNKRTSRSAAALLLKWRMAGNKYH